MTTARENPLAPIPNLCSQLSAYFLKKKHASYAQNCQAQMLHKLTGNTICVCMDASTSGDENFLIVYLISAKTKKPTFYKVVQHISNQEDYATSAADFVTELKSIKITVGSFCTDGLKAQVQALKWTYKGLPPFV
jgi:hypothetical protein